MNENKQNSTTSQKSSNKDDKPLANNINIHVKIYAPYKVYYDGNATSVSAVNDTGPFDILAGHHNFMTLINSCDIVVQNDNDKEKFTVSRGIMHVKDNYVVVFLDI